MFQGGGGGAIRRYTASHTIDLLNGKYFCKGQSLCSKNNLKRTPLKFAFKCTITFVMKPFPALRCKHPFSRLSDPLEGQIKLSFVAVKIPRTQNHSSERTKARIIF